MLQRIVTNIASNDKDNYLGGYPFIHKYKGNMKTNIYIILSIVLLNLSSIYSQTFEANGINYNIISANDVEVINKTDCYIGDIIIPSSVIYSGNTYDVTRIGYEAFKNCDITSISLPNSITTIREYAFRDCRDLITLTLPDSITTIEQYAFLYCTELISVDLSNQITIIDRFAFANCNALTAIDIPETVQIIDGYAFTNCTSLETVSIPSSVTNIGVRAFDDCINLNTFNVYIATPIAINSDVFNNVNLSGVNLFVPSGSETDYNVASVWQDFGSINGTLSTVPISDAIELKTFPNPTNDYITISGLNTIEDYEIYDINGNRLLLGKTSNQNFIDIQSLRTGMYIIKVGNSFTEKIIKI